MHSIARNAMTLMSSRILVLPSLQELKEFLRTSLLKKSHERALDCLHFCTGYFRDLAIAIDEATSDLLEFEVSSNVGMNKNSGEFTRSNNEFGNKIDCIVSVAT